jgi:hypothetical protein
MKMGVRHLIAESGRQETLPFRTRGCLKGRVHEIRPENNVSLVFESSF